MTHLEPSRRSFLASLAAAPLAQRIVLGADAPVVTAETVFGKIRGAEHDGKIFKGSLRRAHWRKESLHAAR
jgi:hypothetical protein